MKRRKLLFAVVVVAALVILARYRAAHVALRRGQTPVGVEIEILRNVSQLLVALPAGMSLASLREVLAMNEVTVHECQRTDAAAPPVPRKRPSVRLTAAERSVLKAFSYCDTAEEIAAQLRMSAATVKSHTDDLFHKLGVHSRAHALGRALRLGLITLRDLIPPRKGGEKSPKKGRDKGRGRGA